MKSKFQNYKNIKSFFPDAQVKRFTHNEQIEWCFKQLFAILNLVITGENIYSYTTMNSHSKVVNRRDKYKLIFINPENIKRIEEVEIPFKNIQLTGNEKQIRIFGDWFSYEFPPEQIYLIYNRMKKHK